MTHGNRSKAGLAGTAWLPLADLGTEWRGRQGRFLADLNYKIIGNLDLIRTPEGMQLSVAYLLIDQHPKNSSAGRAFSDVRQIRGYNWGGMHVFTVWIEHGDELSLGDCESNMKLLSHDGILKDIGPTGRLKIGKFECFLIKADPDRELVVWDHLCHTNDPEAILNVLEEYYRAPNIPVTVYVPVASRRGLRDRLVSL